MHRSTQFLVVFLAFAIPLQAEEKGWEMFDSSKRDRTSQPSDAQVIYEDLLKLLEAWNADNIDRYLELYWKSPNLSVLRNMEQLNGWQNLHDFLAKTFQDPKLMGHAEPVRIQIKLLTPTLAYRLLRLKFTFPDSKKLEEVRTMVLQKFKEGWKIIGSQACSAELQ